MRQARSLIALVLGGLLLSACGHAPANASPFRPSANCTVSVTNVDYAGCDLSHKNLSGLDLQSDNFRRTNLTGADLDGANLQGVQARGANTTGVRTDDTTVCENALFGPCDEPGLKAKGHASAGH
jgi:uncharacterized protein YjbI with pentapeptide repeats